jgi:hypothetical protein
MLSIVRTIALSLVLAAVLVPTALGATRNLTKQQVIARGSLICRAAQRRVENTPGPRSQNPFGKSAPRGDKRRALSFIDVYAGSLASVRHGLGELVPLAPSRGRPLLVSFVSQLGPAIAAFRAAHAAALAHHYPRALDEVHRAFGLFATASAKTKAYGFPKGVCQAGS